MTIYSEKYTCTWYLIHIFVVPIVEKAILAYLPYKTMITATVPALMIVCILKLVIGEFLRTFTYIQSCSFFKQRVLLGKFNQCI